MMNRRHYLFGVTALAGLACLPAYAAMPAKPVTIPIDTPVSPPEWALLQRQLLAAQSEAAEAFYNRYFDARGYFQCFERWGANDGPDDAIENVNDWPHLHALGGSDKVLELYTRAYEGHVKQYSEAKTIETPIARQGMYYREFPVMNDWQHLSEGLSVFNLMGLSDPKNQAYADRVKRFSGFYIGEDAEAKNYDKRRKLIRSMINGSKGPMLKDATPLDWAGDPFDTTPFFMEHGEGNYQQTLDHYNEYTEVVGDNPLNLQSTSLVMNAYLLTGERKYRDWLTGYVGAWIKRAKQNGGVLPSHVDLKGRLNSKDHKWYGGVYGWGFSPVVPQTGEREDRNRVPRSVVAFLNLYLMTGDDQYLQVWRTQTDVINKQSKPINGVMSAPTMYGKDGWYSYKPGPYSTNGLDIWYMSMREDDFKRADTDHPWVNYLRGKNDAWPVKALRDNLERVRKMVQHLREDKTTPQTRLADAVLNFNPVSVAPLIHMINGGIHIARPPWSKTSPSQGGALLYARLRHFDPVKRRAGLPEDVAALVSDLTDTSTTLTLVNTNPVEARRVTVQAGGYGEHEFSGLAIDGKTQALSGNQVTFDLAAGAGVTLKLNMRRHVNTPTLAMPWDKV
jgi:hypothetical protein